MALTVDITGDLSIQQGEQTTLTATVTDANGNTPPGTLTYHWTAPRGRFIGATNESTAVWEADFTDPNDVEVAVSCAVGRAADASPTVSTGSLTAMNALGITGQILNMYITETEASSNGSNKVIYAAGSSDSALDPGSDDDITNAINTWRVQYHAGNDWLILNNDGSGDLDGFFRNNTTQSVYLVFSDGDHFEITNARYDDGSTAWCRWDVTAVTGLAAKLDAIGADDTLLVGVGDAGSIGIEADSGTGTAQVTAAAEAAPGVLHVWDNSDANIRVIPDDIGDGVTGTAIRTYTVTGLTDVQSLVFDGTHLHATRWNDETVHVFSPNTADGEAAAVVRTYEVSGIRQPGAMAFDGQNIHIGDREDDNFRVVAPDTADAETATVIRTYTVPGVGDMRGMTYDGTNLHIADYTDDNFRVIAVPTTDGAQAILRTYTVAGVSLNRAIAYADGNIHVSDVNDDNFRVVANPTGSGSLGDQTILRTYTVTGVGEPRGMTLVPNTAPVFDQASYSFSDVAIAVNTVAGTVHATDANNDPLSYSLTGADAALFAIDGDGEITVATELAESSNYSFNVVVNDGTVDVTMPVTLATVTSGPPTTATFTIEGPTDDIYAGQTIDFTITSNIDITDFTFDDVVLTGGTFVSFTLTSERTWRYRVTADSGAGAIALIIREDSVMPGNNAISQTFTRNANPTVTITTTDTDIRIDHIFTVELQWSSNVTGFANADVTVTGATKLNFTASSGRNYVLALRSSTTPGDIVVTVRENAVDQRNAETAETFVNNDLATVTLTPRETSIRGGRSTVVDITFTENVTNVNLADFSVDVGTVSNLTGSGDTYEVTVTAPATGSGNITLTLTEEVTQPENHAATATIAYQPLPAVAITFDEAQLDPGGTTRVTMQWSEVPAGFTASDVSASMGTLTGFTGSGTTYTATLTAPSSGSGTITITIPADSIDEGNALTTAAITFTVGPLSFGSTTIPNQTWTIGTEVDLSLPAATGGEGTISYSLTGALPTGVSFTPGTRTLAGTPNAAFASATFTYTAQDNNDSVELTFTIAAVAATVVAREGAFQQIRVSLRLEIEGQDITSYLVPGQPLQFNTDLDFPDFGVFKAAGLQILLDNQSGRFDTGGSFWLDNSLPASGSGAKALLTVTRDGDAWRFAGQVVSISHTLKTKITTCVIRDLSLLMRFGVDPSVGQELTRRITDYDGATADYTEGQYWFRLPTSLYPVKPGTVSGKIIDGMTETAITIVDAIATSGTLSPTTASIDAENGILKFEAEPEGGVDAAIELTWTINFHYGRADKLLGELLKGADVVSAQGLTDAQARYGITQAQIKDLATKHFSSHGRPYVQENGVVRWLRQNGDIWQMIQDQRFLEYDADSDEYSLVSDLPMEDISGIDMTGYGEYIADESFSLDSSAEDGIAVDPDAGRIYVLDPGTDNARILPYLFDGTLVDTEILSLDDQSILNTSILQSLALDDNYFYAYATRSGNHWIWRFPRTTGLRDTSFQISTSFTIASLDLTPTRIIVIGATITQLRIYDHSGNRQTTEETTFRAALTARNLGTGTLGVTANSTQIFVRFGNPNHAEIRVFTHAYVYDADGDITLQNVTQASSTGLASTNTRLYWHNEVGTASTLDAYRLGAAVSFGNYIPFQFTTIDNDTIYFIAANNTQGNAVSASTLRRIKVYRHVKSTGVWTDLLNATTGQPQLSEAYKLDGAVVYLANNRKNFEAIEHSNETLLFYRRVQATASGIAYFNDSDDSVNDVNSFAHMGAEDYGYPYSMDFVLDQRSDGVHVYTFVVRHELDTGDYDGGWLRIYRERVEPSGAETQIFNETFTESMDEEDYPVSVHSVILADDRDKFYFVLDWHGEGDRPGKSELCTIAKDGTGSRTVIKTYDNPLLCARSPVEADGKYYYLEGGWVRRAPDGSDDPRDQHHYPDEGGHLIEIDSSDAVVDHGLVRRDGTKADSPDPDNDIYDGWGRFNAVISNMVRDGDGNLRFVAGSGAPYNVDENLPFSSIKHPIFLLSNYHWLQWGNGLASKIPQFKTEGKTYWGLAQGLTQLLGWELGFGPAVEVVEAFQAAHSGASDWSANSLAYLRPPSVRRGTLRTAIADSGAASIAIDGVEVADFPAGICLIDQELFRYTGRTADTDGVTLSGVTRAQDGSLAAAHNADADVYFVAALILDTDTSLIDIDQKYLDITNLYNNIRLNYAGGDIQKSDATSIAENGEFTLSIDTDLLTAENATWAEYLVDLYLSRYKSERELLNARVPIDVNLDLGELVVVKAGGGVNVDFGRYAIVRQSQDLQRFQTQLILREAD